MKPLDGTFAANAIEHGVAGLNIDGGRVPVDSDDPVNTAHYHAKPSVAYGKYASKEKREVRKMQTHPSGRWPANIILDETAAKELDAQSGVLTTSGGALNRSSLDSSRSMGAHNPSETFVEPSSGGASRFFYVAKPSKSERNAGLDKENHHSTVKPVTLLSYLARLTKTPTGGVVLDPFMGSGSTGIACIQEGREFIGIEKEPEYFEIAKRRIRQALENAGNDMFLSQNHKDRKERKP